MAAQPGPGRGTNKLLGTKAGVVLSVLGLALGFAAGGLALAGATSNVVHACVNNSTRVVTIPAGSNCPAGTSTLSWNVRGPAGPTGPAGPSASASASASPTTPTALASSDSTLLSATVTTKVTSRIEASGGGTFRYAPANSSPGAAELDCGLSITPAGGSASAMGNRVHEDFSGGLAYEEPGSAGGAAVKSPGTYVVKLLCNQGTAAHSTLSFLSGDLNVVAAGSP